MKTQKSVARWLLGGALLAGLVLAACGSDRASESDSAQKSTGGAGQDVDAIRSEEFSDGALAPDGGPAPAGDMAASDGEAPASLPSQLDRKIIQVATISLRTEEVSRNFENVSNIAAAAGGYVSGSSFGNDGDRQRASITIRVPGTAYQDALSKLRKLGEVAGEESSANDVTEQVTDLESRLRNLKATEAQYLDFMTRARDINEVLTVQDRLNATRSEIEQTQGRLELLANQTDQATITVHLDPPIVTKAEPKSGGVTNPLEVAQDAFAASIVMLLALATVIVAVGAFSWWLVLLFGVGALIVRRQLRPQPRP